MKSDSRKYGFDFTTYENRVKILDESLQIMKSLWTKKETNFLKWIELNYPLTIQVDGSNGNAFILKKPPKTKEIINENEALGI